MMSTDTIAAGGESLLVQHATAARPIQGEFVSGDLDVVVPFRDGVLMAAIDGLGHGPEAALAARVAADVLRRHPEHAPTDLMRECHEVLRGTRGAAILLAAISATGVLSWCGIGNVEGWRCHWDTVRGRDREALISTPGVVGYNLPRLRERTTDVSRGDVIVLATDGVRPQLIDAIVHDVEPETLAETILTRYERPQDDALVLVGRYLGGAS